MFCPYVAEVARISWWMSAFGSETAKPQYAYSNSPAIRKLHHFGNSSSKVKKNHLKVETCRQYQNKEGKACYTGTRQLKATEILDASNCIIFFISACIYEDYSCMAIVFPEFPSQKCLSRRRCPGYILIHSEKQWQISSMTSSCTSSGFQTLLVLYRILWCPLRTLNQ